MNYSSHLDHQIRVTREREKEREENKTDIRAMQWRYKIPCRQWLSRFDAIWGRKKFSINLDHSDKCLPVGLIISVLNSASSVELLVKLPEDNFESFESLMLKHQSYFGCDGKVIFRQISKVTKLSWQIFLLPIQRYAHQSSFRATSTSLANRRLSRPMSSEC